MKINKLDLMVDLPELVKRETSQNGMQFLRIENEHIYAMSQLDLIHRDPFDRLLVAQALVTGFTLITIDETLRRYPIQTIWE